MEDIRVALAQINCIVGNLERNLEKHRQAAYHAREQGARIVLYPETSLTGYLDEAIGMRRNWPCRSIQRSANRWWI